MNTISFQQFLNKYMGQPVDWDKALGAQCVDLFRFYVNEVLGLKQTPRVEGAKDIWSTASDEDFEKIKNTPSGVPQTGDIVIWDKNEGGGYGHVGIVVDANVMSFRSFDQNYPKGYPARIVEHNYDNVIGWLRSKKGNQAQPVSATTMVQLSAETHTMLVTKSDRYDKFSKAGFENPDQIIDYKKSIESQLSSLKEKVSEQEKIIENQGLALTKANETLAQATTGKGLNLGDQWELDHVVIKPRR